MNELLLNNVDLSTAQILLANPKTSITLFPTVQEKF